MKNKKLLIVILVVLITLMSGWWFLGKAVTIATDKTEYKQGEEIKITISNSAWHWTVRYEHNLLYGMRVEKYETTGWEEAISGYVDFYCPDVCTRMDIEPPEESTGYSPLFPGETRRVTWAQDTIQYTSKDDGKIISHTKISPGKYRFIYYYCSIGNCWHLGIGAKIYSNEFTVK